MVGGDDQVAVAGQVGADEGRLPPEPREAVHEEHQRVRTDAAGLGVADGRLCRGALVRPTASNRSCVDASRSRPRAASLAGNQISTSSARVRNRSVHVSVRTPTGCGPRVNGS